VQQRKTRRGLLDGQTFSYCRRAYKGRFGLKMHLRGLPAGPEAQRSSISLITAPCRLLDGVLFETQDDEHVFADRRLLGDNASFGRQTGGRHEAGPAWLTRKLPWRTVDFVVAAINK